MTVAVASSVLFAQFTKRCGVHLSKAVEKFSLETEAPSSKSSKGRPDIYFEKLDRWIQSSSSIHVNNQSGSCRRRCPIH